MSNGCNREFCIAPAIPPASASRHPRGEGTADAVVFESVDMSGVTTSNEVVSESVDLFGVATSNTLPLLGRRRVLVLAHIMALCGVGVCTIGCVKSNRRYA